MFLFVSFAVTLVASTYGQVPMPRPTAGPTVPVVVPIATEPPAPLPFPRDEICITRNGFYKKDDSCDAYVECRDYRALNRLCPEGLNYNPAARWPNYPCNYPMEVPCINRASVQQPKPTPGCPHQYGIFPSEDTTPESCGHYQMCVAGRAIFMKCPVGLAFNPAIGQCDWPEFVSTCNVQAFLGFTCPPIPVDSDGRPIDIIQNYKHEGDCTLFYSCQLGRLRLLSCDYGFAFDPALGHCVDEELTGCVSSLYTAHA